MQPLRFIQQAILFRAAQALTANPRQHTATPLIRQTLTTPNHQPVRASLTKLRKSDFANQGNQESRLRILLREITARRNSSE
jgi:hypothetical protein